MVTAAQESLKLTCSPPNKRPRVLTDTMRMEACLAIADSIVKLSDFQTEDAESVAADIFKVTRWGCYLDGYEIARELERRCSWDCDKEIVDELDCFEHQCRRILEAAEKVWGAENQMERLIPDGTAIIWRGKSGIVTGLCPYTPFAYYIKTPGCDDNSRFVAVFEEVVPA